MALRLTTRTTTNDSAPCFIGVPSTRCCHCSRVYISIKLLVPFSQYIIFPIQTLYFAIYPARPFIIILLQPPIRLKRFILLPPSPLHARTPVVRPPVRPLVFPEFRRCVFVTSPESVIKRVVRSKLRFRITFVRPFLVCPTSRSTKYPCRKMWA